MKESRNEGRKKEWKGERASEAIGQRETKEQWFTSVVHQRALPSVTLEQVRDDLATITGSLSDVVLQLR